jgi:hypothetical protein
MMITNVNPSATIASELIERRSSSRLAEVRKLPLSAEKTTPTSRMATNRPPTRRSEASREWRGEGADAAAPAAASAG